MPRPCSADLRERALLACERDGGGCAEVARCFRAGVSTLRLWRRQARDEGRRAPRPGRWGAGPPRPDAGWGRWPSWWRSAAARLRRSTPTDADSKLIVGWLVGDRDAEAANAFMLDVAGRLASRVQLTTDAHKPYLLAVEGAFGADVDFAQLMKLYGTAPESAKGRYSPAECIGVRNTPVEGRPDPEHVSNSYVERRNLTMRMNMRRFTRLTNAFSKRVEGHAAMVAIYALWYNFVRIHKSLRVTPAMAAGVADKLWSMEDVVALLDAREAPPAKRGPYKPRQPKVAA